MDLPEADSQSTLFEAVRVMRPGQALSSALRGEEPGESSCGGRLSREQLMDRILTYNATVRPEFLETFNESQLQDYLDHLAASRGPRGRTSARVRTGDTPAIMSRESQI